MAPIHSTNKPLPTIQATIRQSFVRAALIPFVCIELTFLLIYWLTVVLSNEQSVQVAKEFAFHDIQVHTVKAAERIEQKLASVSMLTKIFAKQTHHVFSQPNGSQPEQATNLALSPQGMLTTTQDIGGSAVFYSGHHAIGSYEQDKVRKTSALDPLMKSIYQSNPLISQIYFNTYDSYNRIFPYIDTLATYKEPIDIPSYNFYYEADLVHNPERSAVWTDAYIDPAGSGWMISSIAPVYSHSDTDKLEAVVGLDITLSILINEILNIHLGWQGYAMVVNQQGSIVAMSDRAEQDLDLKELIEHDYQQTIKQDSFKPDEFNLLHRPDTQALLIEILNSEAGVTEVSLKHDKIVSWAKLPETNWYLLYWAPSEQIEQRYSKIKAHLTQVGWLMVAGLIFFYLVFYAFIHYQSSRLGRGATKQLGIVSQLVESIGRGNYWQQKPHTHYEELDALAHSTIRMGRRLGEAYNAVAKAEYHAGHDKLTTLPNRYLMEEHLNHSIDVAKRNRQLLAVLFIDLNKFKQINDTLGHNVGDVVLKTVATRVTSKLRHSDIVARYGGDEFVAILNDMRDEQAVKVLLDHIKTTIALPIEYQDGQCQLTASIGYALYPRDGEDSQSLVIRADTEMYKQKPAKHPLNRPDDDVN